MPSFFLRFNISVSTLNVNIIALKMRGHAKKQPPGHSKPERLLLPFVTVQHPRDMIRKSNEMPAFQTNFDHVSGQAPQQVLRLIISLSSPGWMLLHMRTGCSSQVYRSGGRSPAGNRHHRRRSIRTWSLSPRFHKQACHTR